jgi:hypothetical protein
MACTTRTIGGAIEPDRAYSAKAIRDESSWRGGES